MPGIGDPAPQFLGTDILTGNPFSLADHAGDVVLIVFSGITWCPPCQFEAPVLAELWDEFKFGLPPHVQFVMVSVGDNDQNQLIAQANNFGLTFPIVVDSSINAAYGVNAVPTLFFVDTDQKICAKIVGASPPADALAEKLRQQLLSCGAGGAGPKIDPGHWAAVAILMFGVSQDGGGLVVTPGGTPIPIDPWGPLHRLTRGQREALIALAMGRLASSFRDGGTRQQLEESALTALEAAAGRIRAEINQANVRGPDRMPVRQ